MSEFFVSVILGERTPEGEDLYGVFIYAEDPEPIEEFLGTREQCTRQARLWNDQMRARP